MINSMNRAWPCLQRAGSWDGTPVGWILGFPPLLHRSEQQRRAGDAGGAPELQSQPLIRRSLSELTQSLTCVVPRSIYTSCPTRHTRHMSCVVCHIKKHARVLLPFSERFVFIIFVLCFHLGRYHHRAPFNTHYTQNCSQSLYVMP